MGKCKYCGESAGLFSKAHKTCQEKHDLAWADLVGLLEVIAIGNRSSDGINDEIATISERGFLHGLEVQQALVLGWERALERCLEDGILSEDEEDKLMEYAEGFDLDQMALDKNQAYQRMVKAGVLRDVMEGSLPERINYSSVHIPFMLQKSEKIVWLQDGVQAYEQRTKREYVGGHHGVSLRVAKGVYYRTGAFKGRPVEKSFHASLGSGLLGITNKHIYFHSDEKGFRVKIDKLVSLEPYSDGFSIQKDGVQAKPQVFLTGDGWFYYNLLTNIKELG